VPRDLPAPAGATATGPVAQPRRSAPSGRRGRRALVLAGLLGLLAGGGAVALLDDDDRAPRPVARVTEAVPAPPDGTVSLGSDLATAGETRDCRGGPVRADSVACTLYQDHLPDATLVVPRNGVVSGWAVRSGTGELALTVLRRRDEGYFQVTRSRNEFVGNAEPHLFTTDLAVDRGDRVGVQVMPGAGVGLRPGAGTTTRRTIPQLSGAIQSPSSGPGGEILLRVYLRPGGRQHLPKGLVGAEAAAAPDGKVVERQRARFGNDVPFEARVVLLHGRGVLDLIRDGRRVSRIDIPDMQAPLGLALKLQLAVEPSLPERVGMYLEFSHLGSDRLLHHYFDATGRRITFVN
jgi:hypothetical protein